MRPTAGRRPTGRPGTSAPGQRQVAASRWRKPAVTGGKVVDGGAKWGTVAESGGRVEPGGGAQMFVGSYTPKLDEKNRLFLPAKFRDQLAEGLVVTKGQDFCLNVFPIADFSAMTNRIQEAPL